MLFFLRRKGWVVELSRQVGRPLTEAGYQSHLEVAKRRSGLIAWGASQGRGKGVNVRVWEGRGSAMVKRGSDLNHTYGAGEKKRIKWLGKASSWQGSTPPGRVEGWKGASRQWCAFTAFTMMGGKEERRCYESSSSSRVFSWKAIL